MKVNLHAKSTGVMTCDSTFNLPHIHFQDKCISKFSTYNIHLLTKMTSCFFSDVSIPTFTNICEADKIKFEYIFIMNYYLQGIYMYELVSSGFC